MEKLRRVLLVHQEPEMQEQIQDLLEETLGEELVVHQTPDEKRAESYLQSEGSELVIAHSDIPYDRKQLSSERRKNGALHLLYVLREQGNPIPFMLISESSAGEDFLSVQHLENCRIVRAGADMQDDIKNSISSLLTSREVQRKVELDITLDLDKKNFLYQLTVRNDDNPVETTPETLVVDMSRLNDVFVDSNDLKKEMDAGGKEWEERLHRLGKHLAEAIFDRNPEMLAKFYRQLGDSKLDDARIRFIVEKDVYPAVLEAVLEKSTDEYWMLNAPVYRKVKMDGRQNPLFKDTRDKQQKLNCLIIEAQFEGYVGKLNENFQALNNVETEAQWLETFLTENKENYGIGEIFHLPQTGCEQSLSQQLQDVLKMEINEDWGGWHIVHYAGHSYYDDSGKAGDENTGYVLLPDGSQVELINAKTFASWLSGAGIQFLYLSSCRSSEEDFAFQLASNMVPAVVGFRWDLDDQMALTYSQRFYEYLFKTQSLESAFFKARKDIHKEAPDNPTWASPILIVQVK